MVVVTILIVSWISIWSIDIKSIIAFSTVSQLSYLFLVYLANATFYFVVFHIVIHALFKSLLFLISAELIHQSIYSGSFINTINSMYISAITLLIMSTSKESILSLSLTFNQISVFVVGIISAIFTITYSLIILFSIFIISCRRFSISIPKYALNSIIIIR